jgi:hypothetical protein
MRRLESDPRISPAQGPAASSAPGEALLRPAAARYQLDSEGNERDYQSLVDAVICGRITAEPGL